MPAITKRVTAKKAPAKKSVRQPGKTNAVEVEVLPEVPDLMPPEVVKQISDVERLIGDRDGMPDSTLAEVIRICAGKSAGFSRNAAKAGASALVYAWGCGMMLNTAKGNLGHGAFGKWRSEHLVPSAMSERTSARYMQLANRCNDVRALLQWVPTLKQAYIECGILPGAVELDGEKAEKEEIPRKQLIFTGMSTLQKDLRLLERNLEVFGNSREKLNADDRRQLQLMKGEIETFYQRILTLLP